MVIEIFVREKGKRHKLFHLGSSCQQALPKVIRRTEFLDFSTNLLRFQASLCQEGVDFLPVTQIVGNSAVDIREIQRLKLVFDLLGRRAVIEMIDDRVQGDARLPNPDSPVGNPFERQWLRLGQF
jgi:hypothetical protein